jgi:hypothetical protein
VIRPPDVLYLPAMTFEQADELLALHS